MRMIETKTDIGPPEIWRFSLKDKVIRYSTGKFTRVIEVNDKNINGIIQELLEIRKNGKSEVFILSKA